MNNNIGKKTIKKEDMHGAWENSTREKTREIPYFSFYSLSSFFSFDDVLSKRYDWTQFNTHKNDF